MTPHASASFADTLLGYLVPRLELIESPHYDIGAPIPGTQVWVKSVTVDVLDTGVCCIITATFIL